VQRCLHRGTRVGTRDDDHADDVEELPSPFEAEEEDKWEDSEEAGGEQGHDTDCRRKGRPPAHAPSLTPKQPRDVKTDRRDAEKLARFYRSGDGRF
jgi:hypothetical protein